MIKKNRVIITITAFITFFAQLWFAVGARADLSGIKFDFMAAVATSYDHATGGGAWNAGQIGTNIVGELEGDSFACGDHVSYLTKISAPNVSDVAAYGAMTIDMKYVIGMDTTGQSGVALGETVATIVNSKANDSAVTGNENSTATLVPTSPSQSGPMFSKGAELYKTVRVTGVEAGESIVVRLDTILHCQADTTPTGNLQVRLDSASLVYKNGGTPVDPAISLNSGKQTVNLKGVQGVQLPSMSLAKTVTTGSGTCPGTEQVEIRPEQQVKYCYALTNTSNAGGKSGAPLFNISLIYDDSGPYPDFTVAFTSGLTDIDGDGQVDDLAPGATAYAEYVVAFDGNQDTTFTNTAIVYGYDRGGVQYSASDTASVKIDAPTPLITLNKLTNGADGANILVGTPITWSYLVTNTGDVTLSNIYVTDDQGVSVICPSSTLAVSASMTCNGYGTAVAGSYSNSATVYGSYNGNTATATDTSSYFGANPNIDIQKTPDSQVVIEGQTGTFTITVTNTGNVALTSVVVSDPNSSNCDKTIGAMAIGEIQSYTCTSPTINANLTNTANVVGYFDTTQVTANDSANITVDYLPNIAMTKTADPTSVLETGGAVTFTFKVDNKALENFNLQSLVDDKFGDLNGQGTCVTPQVIAAGASYVCTLVKTLSSDLLVAHTNVATASGVDPEGHPATASDDATVTFIDVKPTMSVTKTANPTLIPESGGNVTYTIVVSNTGPETLFMTSLIDDKLGDLNGKGTCVAPQTIVGYGSYTCTVSTKLGDWTLNPVTNVVTAYGQDNDGNTTSASDDATVNFIDLLPTISVTKTVNPTVVRSTGEYVDYTIKISNTGPEAVVVTSLVDSAVTLSPACLALVGQTIPIAGSIQCLIHVFMTVAPGTTFVNTATANAKDNEGNNAVAMGSANLKSYWFGRTPGFWKNHPDAWKSGYLPAQYVQDVFSIPSTLLKGGILDLDGNSSKDTLMNALSYKGGSTLAGAAQIMLRAATAALLNKAYYGPDYPAETSVSALISHVNTVLATKDRAQYIALGSYYDYWNNGFEGPLP